MTSKNPNQLNFIPDVRDKLIELHQVEYFSDQNLNKEAMDFFPEIDPMYDMVAPIEGINVPMERPSVTERPSDLGFDMSLRDNQMVLTST